MKKNYTALTAVLLMSMLVQTGCFQKFYATNTRTQVTSADVDSLLSPHRHIILHYTDTIFALNAIQVNEGILLASRSPLPTAWSKGLDPQFPDKNRVPAEELAEVLRQCHVYVGSSFENKHEDEQVKVPLSSITRLDVYGLDREATSGSTTAGVIGIVAPVLALIGLLIAVGNMSFSPLK